MNNADVTNMLSDLGVDTTKQPVKSNSGQKGVTSSTEERALKLLGSGIQPEQVAAALGVTASRISQLLADEDFAEKVAIIRYNNLQSHNARDSEYDNIEDALLEKLKSSLALMVKPATILKALQVVNSAKRRGQSAPQQVINQQTVVQLIMPQTVMDKFTVNSNNQVIQAGEQQLLTMQSGTLLSKVEEADKDEHTNTESARKDR